MRCEDLAAMLTEFFEGELDTDTEEDAIEHLATCDHCELVLAETREVTRLAHDHGRATLDDAGRERMFENLASRIRASDHD